MQKGKLRVSYSSGDVDFNATDIVNQVRLKKIERDHKSIGATLDKRSLFKIEDPPLPSRLRHVAEGISGFAEKDEIVKAVEEVDNSSPSKVLAGIKIKSLDGDFETEQLVWRAKSNAKGYFSKRQFNFPELHQFYENLLPAQMDEFRRKCLGMLVALTKRLREEAKASQIQMNKAGIFHPEANEHRVHCQYLADLYRE